MQIQEPVQFKGVPGSPYTRKMLAYLRFRHIRYRLLIGSQTTQSGLPEPKVQLLPTFFLPDENNELQAVVDSTPLIRRFEENFSQRQTIPNDPVLAFLNYLIEDYADEWLTKAMFHYRWYYQADIDMAGTILPRWTAIQSPEDELQQMRSFIADRQISRLYVVGSNDLTAPVIEASYTRFLHLFDAMVQRHPFVFGARPSSADFGIYAQLTQLAKFDPTPAAICMQETPRIHAWTDLVDDLSGNSAEDQDWISLQDSTDHLREFLSEIGRVYAPALLANAKALQAGSDTMTTTIDGQPWEQPTFPYQAKCLQWINEEYQQLGSNGQGQVDALFADTGCEQMIFK
ncbi:MAG: glutathione S-transferase N-terminal domain-containing protein [Pseudomonadota bacterium]|nr:glutathione S-transferase N-terminal domain-containing protein [Pseudomonadota bacterium]